MSLKSYYGESRQYCNRFNTDTQFFNGEILRKYSGVMDKRARFVEEKQLLDGEYWHLFTEQFKAPSDDKDKGWRGEYFGKMMRGASMTYMYTKNERLYGILEKAALEILDTQDELGRISTYSIKAEFNGWDLWCRKYVLLGLLHFYEICRDSALRDRIITALTRHLDYITEHIGGGDKKPLSETSDLWGATNSASLLEPVMNMYNITGKKAYLDFAEYIIEYLTESDINIFKLAFENKVMPYEYPVIKAYEMMSCFEGLLEYYRVTGNEKCKTAVINFADAVRKTDITVIGCAGCRDEMFDNSAATQTDCALQETMQETCVTVTWMKLCNQLLLLTGDAKYADYIENSFYNALHGAINTEESKNNGGFMFDSYSPLMAQKRGRVVGGYKDISKDKHYGCCVAIGAAGTALPLLTAVTETEKGIVFNYYEEGSITAAGFTLSVKTEYPVKGNVKITLDSAAGEREIKLRIPSFTVSGTRLSVNGSDCPVTGKSEESFYVSLAREWKSGDVIEIEFNMNPRVVRPCGVAGKPETRNCFAVLYGPLVLARDARLTEVGNAVVFDGNLKVKPKDHGGFDCLIRADVSCGDGTFEMIDYQSAGKTFDESSLTEVWIKCK